jgi:3',5'-cyclic AMP phosphodiesterase CpdA
MKKTLVAVLIALVSLTLAEAKQRKAEDPVLQFNENGKFKIVQFTDTHLGYNNRAVYDKSVDMITSIVRTEKPDLVIFTGDIVTGAPMKQGLDNLFAPLDEMGVPFMLLLGNHDREDELPAWEIAKITISHKSSINTMSQDYLDDIALRIKSSDGKKVAAVVYGMDSNDYSVVPDHWDYGWISHSQIDWYRNKSKDFTKANGNIPVPSYMFMHIPLQEYTEADRDGHLTGNNFEGVFPPELNSGILAAMEECADVHGIFCGHDHTNDFVSKLGAVAHVYGRCSGNGHPDRGGRVVELSEGDYGFRSWIREWDGDMVQDYTYEYPVDYRLRKATPFKGKKNGIAVTKYTGVTSLDDIESKGTAVSTEIVEHARSHGNEPQNIGFVYEGMLYVPETSLWTLHIMADEHGSFTIDDFTFNDTDWHRGLKRVYLEKGYHPIKIKVFTDGFHVMRVQWRPQDVDRLHEIPVEYFFVK